MARRRLDGITRLTPQQIKERDDKMFRWLNRMRMARVYEAAQRAGWFYWSGEQFAAGARALDYGDRIEAVIEGSGRFRVEGYDPAADVVTLRKISSDWSE